MRSFLLLILSTAIASAQTTGTGATINTSIPISIPVTEANTTVVEPQNILPSETIVLTVGQTKIQALIYKGKSLGLLLFNMHDDETTSVEAAKTFIMENGGTLVQLKHFGQRLITFELNKRSNKFDPNRIFTEVGISKTLEKYGNSPQGAANEVDRFAKELIARFFSNPGTIVAMHNSTNNHFSVLSYQKGGEYEADGARVFVNPGKDIDDFFYVIEEKLFDRLSSMGYNVVLQNNATVTDDGSLSVFCGQKQIRYINVEAERGHKAEQLRMLRALLEALKN